ncbi:aldo/keto reductase [Actinopolyspora mortivallis]|uniref:aldo/keto reductase n=1 Tax=Actinopolyspora mortivallis TaxID=33906 RepID=UPI000375F471|nr:aldo/keto reductase [Actinopolyspora mortivallis]
MRYRQLGNTGMRVSRLALGTMTWGNGTDVSEAAAQLSLFHQVGGTLVDTSPVHQHGHGETMLGSLLNDTVARDDLLIATTTGPRTSRAALLDSLHGSLRRLGVDHIDLWQLHGWDSTVPLEETLDTLDTAVTSGKVRYIGVVNQRGWQLATMAALQSTASGRIPLACVRTEYSLLQRLPEHELLPAARHHHVSLLPCSPLAGGVLTGKYRTETPTDSRAADPEMAPYIAHHRTPRSGRIVHALATAADGLGTSPAAVALAWIRDRPGVGSPVLGARTTEQLKSCLECEQVTLPPAIQAALDDVSALPQP